ncbi:Protein CBG26869 [Caenorhabditis briggsae]|uniref:RING-type domain-containing protein n=2 Tax=Caenorhabditis briggsae TaxID=6238 RepID=A0AAE8ZYD9_CAEBR|nr:Protein CBG26869 [Caenorhabditis briggsae]ULT85964.1 hypothetical protein L3Y34_005977 [Caenorhabditis briggsae]CAR99599.1 Protein CBG26869 [Caenorhabditis briggsae]
MYTSWNRAIEIVIGTNLVACFLFLFCIMIAMGIFELHYEHYAQCLLFTAILFSVAFISMMIHGIYIRRKISRGEVRRVEVHFDNFKIGSCIVSFSGVIVNLMVCCFGTEPEIYNTCHIIYAFINLMMLGLLLRSLETLVMDIEMHKKHLKNVLLCQIAGIIILPLLTHHIRTWNEISAILISQLICMPSSWICMLSSTDSDSSESQIDCSEIYQLTGSLCGVCYRTYSDSSRKKTPRILTECGHTICEGCAGRILKANYSSYLPCP